MVEERIGHGVLGEKSMLVKEPKSIFSTREVSYG